MSKLMTTVVNARHHKFDVYIGRQTSYAKVRYNQMWLREEHILAGSLGAIGRYGNPMRFGAPCQICHKTHADTPDGRLALLECYREHLSYQMGHDKKFEHDVLCLHGLVLGCFCDPLPCHGHVIATLLNNLHNLPGMEPVDPWMRP